MGQLDDPNLPRSARLDHLDEAAADLFALLLGRAPRPSRAAAARCPTGGPARGPGPRASRSPRRPPPRARRRRRPPSRSAMRTFSRRCGRRSKGSTSAKRPVAQGAQGQQRRGDAVAARGEVGPDDVAGLLAAEVPVALDQGLDHVAVADLGLVDLDALVAELGVEAEVGHDRDGDAAGQLAALAQVARRRGRSARRRRGRCRRRRPRSRGRRRRRRRSRSWRRRPRPARPAPRGGWRRSPR